MAEQPSWRDPRLANNYVQDIRRLYQQQPGIKITLQLLLSVFTVAFFTFFAIRPTLSTITTLLRRIEDQKEVDVRLDTKIVQLLEAQNELTANETDLPLINLAIPQAPDLEGFARRLEVLAVEENSELASLQFQAIPLVGTQTSLESSAGTRATRNDGNFSATFDFTLNGTQESILSFLRKLETIDRAVAVTKIIFTRPTLQQQSFFSLTATGKGTIYYQPLAQTP